MSALLHLTPELLGCIMEQADASSLPALRLSCKTIYKSCLKYRWDAIICSGDPDQVAAKFQPVVQRLNEGYGFPYAFTYTKSVTIDVESFHSHHATRPRSPTLSHDLAVFLQALTSDCANFKHLRINLEGLNERQLKELKREAHCIQGMKLESLRSCYDSWPIIYDRLDLSHLQRLRMPCSYNLDDSQRREAPSLKELQVDYADGLTVQDYSRIRFLFPRLQTLYLLQDIWEIDLPLDLREKWFDFQEGVFRELRLFESLSTFAITIPKDYEGKKEYLGKDLDDLVFRIDDAAGTFLRDLPRVSRVLVELALEKRYPYWSEVTRVEGAEMPPRAVAMVEDWFGAVF